MKKSAIVIALAAGLAISGAAQAADPVFMSAEWATEACKGWNADPVLTTKLKERKWIDNNKGRGYKIIQIYRIDCPKSPRVELKLEDKDGKALCSYGGGAVTQKLDDDVDYLMFATDEHWKRMGAGQDGPMKAMMFGRLKFEGPKMEAMGNMAPFSSFLMLTGKVPSDRSSCPGGGAPVPGGKPAP
ncbi:MAG: SCP2 sterol-binding domain-containing protein [Pseudomonadota bacterium]